MNHLARARKLVRSRRCPNSGSRSEQQVRSGSSHTAITWSLRSSWCTTLVAMQVSRERHGVRNLPAVIDYAARVVGWVMEHIRWLENLRQSTLLFGDPSRCVHIGDRESDIYELFCTSQELGTHFLVRTCVDRLAGDGLHAIADEMD
jgi:hypothetical protein